MTTVELQEFLNAMRRITNEALKSKESARQLLVDAGIWTEESKKNSKKKKK
jgi:hypothetical protein